MSVRDGGAPVAVRAAETSVGPTAGAGIGAATAAGAVGPSTAATFFAAGVGSYNPAASASLSPHVVADGITSGRAAATAGVAVGTGIVGEASAGPVVTGGDGGGTGFGAGRGTTGGADAGTAAGASGEAAGAPAPPPLNREPMREKMLGASAVGTAAGAGMPRAV